MTFISPQQWASYKTIIDKVNNDFAQDEIQWFRLIRKMQRYGEDNKTLTNHTLITLKGLISYNVYRSWPMTKETESGAIDKESMLIIFNKQYLTNLGYINANGNFDFNPAEDYFIHQGQKYRSAGETPASQAFNDPLLIYIVLKRMETNTGSPKY